MPKRWLGGAGALKADAELRDIPVIMVTVAPDRGIGLSLRSPFVLTPNRPSRDSSWRSSAVVRAIDRLGHDSRPPSDRPMPIRATVTMITGMSRSSRAP